MTAHYCISQGGQHQKGRWYQGATGILHTVYAVVDGSDDRIFNPVHLLISGIQPFILAT